MSSYSPARGRSAGADKLLAIGLATLVVATAGAFHPRPADAECALDFKPGESLQGLNYEGYAVTLYDDGSGQALYVGGGFDSAGGIRVSGIARWDGRYWSSLGTGATKGSACGQVKALAVYDGELIAGGAFNAAGGTAAANIARWNGKRWAPLGDGADFDVLALVVYEGDLVAAGNFTTAGGMTVNRIARWNGETWAPLGSGFNDAVGVLAVYGGELIAGGRFTATGSVKVNQIARWDGSAWQSVGGGVTVSSNPHISALIPYEDNLVVGGLFSAVGGTPARNIAQWDGARWTPVGDGLDASVLDLIVHNGELIAGGFFERAGEKPSRHVAKWDGTQWSPLDGGLFGYVTALVSFGNDLIATGAGTAAGYTRADNIARWDGARWLPLGAAMDRPIHVFADYNGELIAGGGFTYINGVRVNCIARLDGAAWAPLAEGLSGGKDGTQAKALAVFKNELIAGGNFTSAGGSKARHIARWDGSAWAPLGEGFNGPVHALTVYRGELVAGGTFTTSGETAVNGIARWDGVAWVPVGGGVSGTWSPGVYALAVWGEDLYAGGLFLKAGGATVNHVARWDGTDWQPMGAGMAGSGYPDVPVAVLTVWNNELVAGGLFTSAGEATATSVARWDGSSWSAMESEGTHSPRQVRSLTVYNGHLIAGGIFTGSGLMSTNGIAQWNGTDWEPVSKGVSGGDGAVLAACVYKGELVVGGSFMTAGGRVSAYLARCAPVEPAAAVRYWRSVRYHGESAGEAAVVLDPAATTGHRIITEPREGGIRRIVVDITGPTDGDLAVEGRVMAEEIAGTGYAYPASLQTLTHNGDDSYTLVIEWPEGLPEQRCYLINLGVNIACLKGDMDCLVRSLTGDVSNDGLVDSADLLVAKSKIAQPVMPDNAAFDVNADGVLNSTDVLTIRGYQDRSAMCP